MWPHTCLLLLHTCTQVCGVVHVYMYLKHILYIKSVHVHTLVCTHVKNKKVNLWSCIFGLECFIYLFICIYLYLICVHQYQVPGTGVPGIDMDYGFQFVVTLYMYVMCTPC